jgi:hypothetical protein
VDPSRYLPERAEDKKTPYAWVGWGAGRHPCCKLYLFLPQILDVNEIIANWMMCIVRMKVSTRIFI